MDISQVSVKIFSFVMDESLMNVECVNDDEIKIIHDYSCHYIRFRSKIPPLDQILCDESFIETHISPVCSPHINTHISRLLIPG